MKFSILSKLLFVAVLAGFFGFAAYAENEPEVINPEQNTVAEHKGGEELNAKEVILDHILDAHQFHFFSFPKADGTKWDCVINLPCIVYCPGHGLSFFGYGKLEETGSYRGFKINADKKIEREDGGKLYDFSITKNVVTMVIAFGLLLLIFRSVSKRYQTNPTSAPKGIQNFMEVVILFVRDEVARPLIGKHKADRYMPYLLTVFFFIWINNMLGLLPFSMNVTGNISVTITLALFTFVITMFSSKKHYWGHLLNPPGVPFGVKLILVPVEVLGVFTKPFALLIRLFANITAGHLIVLSFILLIFIFSKMSLIAGVAVSPLSVAFSVAIYFLELLVAVLQAFIFTMLSALYIGESSADHGHEEHAH